MLPLGFLVRCRFQTLSERDTAEHGSQPGAIHQRGATHAERGRSAPTEGGGLLGSLGEGAGQAVGIDKIFSRQGTIKLFWSSDDLRADGEMLLWSSSWAAFYRSVTMGKEDVQMRMLP